VSTTAAPPATGTEVAPGYTVLRKVADSGTFVVYEVWSEERHCRCVAKVVAPERRHDGKTRRRLVAEGELLLRLAHPHIVRAYELHEEPETVLILEALPGMTLEYWLSELEQLELGDLVLLGEQVCSAIAYLHEHGVLHLDLKPGNLLCSYGVVRTIDLSLARPPGRGHRGAGTHVYLAPEQALGEMVTAATDAWGIGAVLWEAAAGRRPFERPEDPSAYEQLQRRAEPVGWYREVPPDLEAVIDGCLEPLPAARPSIAEIWAVVDSLRPQEARK